MKSTFAKFFVRKTQLQKLLASLGLAALLFAPLAAKAATVITIADISPNPIQLNQLFEVTVNMTPDSSTFTNLTGRFEVCDQASNKCDTSDNTVTASNEAQLTHTLKIKDTSFLNPNGGKLITSFTGSDDVLGQVDATSPPVPYTVTGAGNNNNNNPNNNNNNNPNGNQGPSNSGTCQFDSSSTKLCSPIKAQTVQDFILTIIKFIMGLLAAAAVVAIVIGGFRMVISGGNPDSVKKARGMITWAMVGLVIAILSYSIIAIVLNAIKQ